MGHISFGQKSHIRKKQEIRNGISPKSIVTNEKGLFAAQNMMYRHTITFYDAEGNPVSKIRDAVNLNEHGFSEYSDQNYLGAPVEGVFSQNGKYLWASNYSMTGPEFNLPGCDDCIGKQYDPSFIYKINTGTFEIENVIKVGSVPKFIAISKDESLLIVSNWTSSDVSIIDLASEIEVKKVIVGPHPRGIAITYDNTKAFVTIMGSNKIAEIDLLDFTVSYHKNIGKAPRSIILADGDSTLYVSLNSSHQILKYDRFSNQSVYCKTKNGPRSMVLSPNEKWLYVVNYFDNVFTKINTDSMIVMDTIKTKEKPIGICGNWEQSEIWVACYTGIIEIFHDFHLEKETKPSLFLGIDLSNFNFKFSSSENADLIAYSTLNIDTTFLANNEKQRISPKINHIPPKQKRISSSENGSQYYIIIGAYSIPQNAQKRKEEILNKGYEAKVIQGSKLNYVSVANYTSKQAAEKGKIEIQANLAGAQSAWILEK